jgi:hypothetical protein
MTFALRVLTAEVPRFVVHVDHCPRRATGFLDPLGERVDEVVGRRAAHCAGSGDLSDPARRFGAVFPMIPVSIVGDFNLSMKNDQFSARAAHHRYRTIFPRGPGNL